MSGKFRNHNQTKMNDKLFNILRCGVLAIIGLYSLSTYGQVIGDSVVAVVNNWKVGDYAIYKNYSGKIRIEAGDTITEYEEPVTLTKILLTEVLPSEDKVFVITTQVADSTKADINMPEGPSIPTENDDSNDSQDSFTEKDQEELQALFMKLSDIPVTILTDFSGEVKDIYNYESLRTNMDSYFNQIITKISSACLPEEIQEGLTVNLERMWNQAVTKEALMARCNFFRYYGYNYPIGMTSEHTKLPLLSNDNEVDATVTFSCEPVETESGEQLIEITSMTTYNSDQVMDSILSSVIGQNMTLNREADSPHISMNITEQFLFDPQTGTVVAHTSQKKTISQGKTTIEYKASEWE